ncbi:MAG: ribonuclease Z [Pseudomonadota bacterium]|nr:ribonuclease Z [Pseudomonadota bacterium]
MGMVVTLIGVGEAFDAVEPNSAALVEADGFSLLIDCGHAAAQALWRARPNPEAVNAVYLTHQHADHVLGLVPVLDRWAFEGRRGQLTLLGTEAGLDYLRRLLEWGFIPTGPRSPFTIEFQVAGQVGRIGPFETGTAPTEHGAPNQAICLESGGRRFAYSGDGRPTEAALALYADAHLLLHECFAAETADAMPGHCDLPTVQAIAGPERIGLYHIPAGQRDAMRARVAGDTRLFVPDAGTRLVI